MRPVFGHRAARSSAWSAPTGLVACAIAVLVAGSAWAGPPYVTDDPEPTKRGGWENYLYVSGTNMPGSTVGQAGIGLNYGAAEDVQLSLALPEGFVASDGLRGGVGDLGFGAKYRFWHSSDESWLPDAAWFPSVTVPSGGRDVGQGHATLFLPVWLQKDFGPWSVFGGGGYDINPGAGQKNYALVGLAVTRSFGERLNLGLEIYHQTPSQSGGGAVTNLGVGAIYQMSPHWAVMASGGPGLETASRSGVAAFYVSLQFTD